MAFKMVVFQFDSDLTATAKTEYLDDQMQLKKF